MAVPVLITDLSATATSNSPADTDAISTTLPQYIRAIESILYTQVSRGADIPSAATLTIPAGGSFFNVTGTTGITSIAANFSGRTVLLKFAGSVALTNSASLALPGGANYTTSAGDYALLVNESGTVWTVMLLGQPARSQAPAGSIMDFAGTTLPAGWLECDGSAVSRTTYAALFAALGTTWGAGDGSTTFNLPNLNGRVTAGRNGSGVGLTATTISATQGAAAFTIAAANLPPHAHNFNVNSGTESAPHTHNVSDPGHVHVTGTAGTANPGGAALAATGYGPNTSAMSAATTGISLSTETASHYHNVAGATDNGPGASSPLSIVQPTAIVMKIIKT